MIKPAFIFLSMIFASLFAVEAQNPVVEQIQRDSIIVIVQSEALARRLTSETGEKADERKSFQTTESAESDQQQSASQRTAGFRVQVFSDNNVRTAKAEARTKAKAISEKFPQYRTNATYEAPFWRVRVGDFRSKSDAEQAADEIKFHFPAYSREIRVVRDRINLK